MTTALASPRSRWKGMARSIIVANPTAASGVRAGRMRVAAGRSRAANGQDEKRRGARPQELDESEIFAD